jgi:hypothetical protein
MGSAPAVVADEALRLLPLVLAVGVFAYWWWILVYLLLAVTLVAAMGRCL